MHANTNTHAQTHHIFRQQDLSSTLQGGRGRMEGHGISSTTWKKCLPEVGIWLPAQWQHGYIRMNLTAVATPTVLARERRRKRKDAWAGNCKVVIDLGLSSGGQPIMQVVNSINFCYLHGEICYLHGVATLPGVWHCRVSAGTGWPRVSILWLGETESLICNFYLSVAARQIVWADPSLRYTCVLLGRSATNQPTNSWAKMSKRTREREREAVVVGWLLNVPATI